MNTHERRLRIIGTVLLLLLFGFCMGTVIPELHGAEEVLVCFACGLVFGAPLAAVADPLYEEWRYRRMIRSVDRSLVLLGEANEKALAAGREEVPDE